MFRSAIKVLLCLGVWSTLLATTLSSETTDLNETEPTDTAEFRQGGQLMPSYPYPPSGAGGAQGGYPSMGNVIRNLYRPPSLGITDKVRHWVKSFMNRRQYVKPYYGGGGGAPISYDFSGKPSFSTGAGGYKAISVPLRQLQKYYKPYYATGAEGAQFAGAGGFNAAAYGAAGSNPSGGAGGGLYASETAGSSHFAGADSSFGSNPFAASSSFGDASALFAANGAGGLYGASGSPSSGLYGSSGSPSSGLFQGAGSSGGGFSVDGSSYGSSDPSSYFGGSSYGSGPSSGGFGSSANGAGSYLSSGSAGGASFGSANGGGAGYGDLYASGANPSPSLYTGSEHHSRGYQQQQQQQGPKYGASSSALYMSSSDDRNGDKSSKELTNSFNVDSSRPAEASYSVSFQPQGKAAYSSFDGAGFQPVAYGSESAGPAFQEKSSS